MTLGLGFLHLGVVSSAGGGGTPPGPDFGIQLIETEASETPSSALIGLGEGQNAVRVFVDLETPADRNGIYLYVKRNSDAVQKIKLYPWSARVIAGTEGDSFAFGTADGRTLQMAAMAHPEALESSFPVTGTANADNGCPPYWAPAAAHVTLAAAGSAFRLVDTSTSEVVFISEFDGSDWTPPRWVRKQSGRATTVRCTYAQVALATLDGATLSIAAPTGATIGGTSTDMVNPFMPTVTGATHSVSDVTELKAAIAAAVAGDEIVLDAGSYALDIPIVHATFAANNGVGGRVGMEGILIRGGTGDKADVILTGNGVGTNGDWNVRGGTTLFQGFKDLTWDIDGLGITVWVDAGKWAFQDVLISGEAGSGIDCFTFGNSVAALQLEVLRMTCEDGSSDLFNGFGEANWNPDSSARLVQCVGQRGGATSSDQCLTTHTGLPVEWYGGLLSDAHTNVAAPDGESVGLLYLFFATITKGARQAGLLSSTCFGCTVQPSLTGGAGFEGGAYFNHINFTGAADSNAVFRTVTNPVKSNYVTATANAGRGFFSSNTTGTSEARYNVFERIKEPIRFGNSAGAGGNANAYGNSFISCSIALGLEDANLVMAVRNNAAKGSTIGVACTATSMPHITTNYNTIDPTIDADFVAGANDLVVGDADLDASYFPTAAGDCDGNGDATLEDFIGDCDPWGYVRVYKADRVSRGARDRPIMHSGAYLHPDLF